MLAQDTDPDSKPKSGGAYPAPAPRLLMTTCLSDSQDLQQGVSQADVL